MGDSIFFQAVLEQVPGARMRSELMHVITLLVVVVEHAVKLVTFFLVLADYLFEVFGLHRMVLLDLGFDLIWFQVLPGS